MPDRAPLFSHNLTDVESASAARSKSPSEILRERAQQLAQAPQESLQAADLLEVIQFRIGRELYAIETQFVEEVISGGEITPIPDAEAVLLGVMNLRGEILAVMDPGLLLNSEREHGDDSWIIVIGQQRTEFGLSVDGVTEVRSIRVSEILPPVKDEEDSLIRGVTADALLVLDGTALLDDPRLHIDDV